MAIITHELKSDLGDYYQNWEDWMKTNDNVSDDELKEFEAADKGTPEWSKKFNTRYKEWMIDQKIIHTRFVANSQDDDSPDTIITSYKDLI